MNPFDPKHNAKVRTALAEQGIEVTPDELNRLRTEAYQTIREKMRERGWPMPDSDEELFRLIKLAYDEEAPDARSH